MMNMCKVLCLVLACGSGGPLFGEEPLRQKLTIDGMFSLAETNSRSIRTFDYAEQEAGQAVRVARSEMLPSVNVSASASVLGDGWLSDRNYSHGENAPMPRFGNNFAVEASQVIYAGGVISNRIAMAGLQQQLAGLDKEKNRQEIRFLLVGNYLELYRLQNQQEVYRQNIEQTKRLLLDINARHGEGLALKNDITRYELQLQSLELALTRVEDRCVILNNELVTVLGLPRETLVEVDTTLLDQMPLLAGETYWQQAASGNSPALQQSGLRIEQARYDEKIVRATRLPSVALFAADHLDGPITIEVPPINKNFNYWYVGVGLKFDIGAAYKSGRKVKLAQLSTQRAAESKLLLEDRLQTEVKVAYVHFAESFTVYRTQLKSLELAVQNYEVVNYRYLNDLALITDMLDASNAKLDAQLQVANAQINILFCYYSLQKAAGTI